MRIAVGRIDRGDPHHALVAGHHRFQIAGMIVAIAAGQARGDVLQRAFGQDRDAVIGLLSVYGAIIAQRLERLARENSRPRI